MLFEDARRVLFAAIEDSGLWEIAWELATLHPERSAGDNRAEARKIIETMWTKKLVEVYGWHEPDGPEVNLERQRIANVLSDDAVWQAPSFHNLCYRVRA